jgi:hypothetical protein
MDSSKLIELRRQAANVYQSRTPVVRDASMHTYELKAKAAAQQFSVATLSQTQSNPNYIPSNSTTCCLTPAGFTSAASPGINTYPTNRLQGGSATLGGISYGSLADKAAGLAICCGPTPPPAEPLGIFYSTCCYTERLPSSTYNAPCTVPGYNQTPHFVQPPPGAMVFGVDCCPSNP